MKNAYIVGNKVASSFQYITWCWQRYLIIVWLFTLAKCLTFNGMIHVLWKLVLILPGKNSSSDQKKKKEFEICTFYWSHSVWIFNILNEHDDMYQFHCKFCAFLAWFYARETSLDLIKALVDRNIKFSVSILCTKK